MSRSNGSVEPQAPAYFGNVMSMPGSAVPIPPQLGGPMPPPPPVGMGGPGQGNGPKPGDHIYVQGPVGGLGGNQMGPLVLHLPEEPAAAEAMKKLIDDIVKSLLPKIQQGRQEKSVQEQNQWYSLPKNMFGAVFWLLMCFRYEYASKAANDQTNNDSDASKMPPNPSENTKDRIDAGQESDSAFWRTFWKITKWLHQFFSEGNLYLCIVPLLVACWLLQFGFIYWLWWIIFEDPTSEYMQGDSFAEREGRMCYTPWVVHFISMSYFLATMAGMVPQAIRNIYLSLVMENFTYYEIIDHDQHRRPKGHGQTWGYFFRKTLCFIAMLSELAIIGFLSFVGFKYIMWSGYSSMDPGDYSTSKIHPWMSGTSGIEEIILATLALQFILDIDENVYKYMLPQAIQTRIEDVKIQPCVEDSR